MIILKQLTLRRGVKVLLNAASVTLNPGEKVALVGRNGAGKSSLFALLTGELHEDGGDFSVPAHWRLGQVAQDMPETSLSATLYVVQGDTRLWAAQTEVQAAEAADDYERMAHAYTALQDAGAHDAPARAQALLLGLGFREPELEQAVNSFSGGWRMRLQLARALMCPADLLLLDEPTNHLDLDALVWLESWLQKFDGTLVVISHDREFLDAVTNVTLHIDAGKLVRYGGNYSKFEELRTQQLELQQGAYVRQQAQIAHLQQFIARFKAKATKARQAQSRVKALERMERVAPLLAESEFRFAFGAPANLPNPMLALRDVDCGYTDDDGHAVPIVHKVSRSVLAGQRIGILGANGQGKSTLVKTIARTLRPLAGTLTEGKGLNIGYFAQQELDVLCPVDTPLQHLVRLARDLSAQGRLGDQPAREQDLRNFLGRFQFSGDMVQQSVGSMSGGEKARLVLCMIVWQRPNLLLLDEPTNHLDLTTREALAMALNGFEGSVMLVSHDRALLRSVCDEFWLVGRGALAPFDGDLDDYQVYLLEEARRQRERARAPSTPAAQAQKAGASAPITRQAERSRPNTSPKLQKEWAELEARMAVLQAQGAELDARLADTTQVHHTELAALGSHLQQVNDELARLEDRWLELGEQLGVI